MKIEVKKKKGCAFWKSLDPNKNRARNLDYSQGQKSGHVLDKQGAKSAISPGQRRHRRNFPHLEMWPGPER
jgi:hypothetical protein